MDGDGAEGGEDGVIHGPAVIEESAGDLLDEAFVVLSK